MWFGRLGTRSLIRLGATASAPACVVRGRKARLGRAARPSARMRRATRFSPHRMPSARKAWVTRGLP